MSTAELLLILNERGITVNVNADRLHIHAPAGVLTDELRAALTANKAEMIAFLECDRFDRLREIESSVNQMWDELEEIGARLGQDHSSFDGKLVRCESKLREYKAMCDLMIDPRPCDENRNGLGIG